MLKDIVNKIVLLVGFCSAWSLAENANGRTVGLRLELLPIPTEMGVGVALEHANPVGTFILRSELALSGGALFLFDIDVGYGYPIVFPRFTVQPEVYGGYTQMGTYWVEHGINGATKLRFEKSLKRWSFSVAPSLRYSNLYHWVSFSTDCTVKYDFIRGCR